LANISSQCVETLSGNRRILAYVLNRLLFTLAQAWEGNPNIDPEPFVKHAHQPISNAITLLQDNDAQLDEILSVIQQLIDAHKRVVI
jgi:hypothetical protein